MEINKSNFDNLSSLFNHIKKNENNILSLKFKGLNETLERNVFQRVVERFIFTEENGGLHYPYKMHSHLKVGNERGNVYLHLKTLDEIKRYFQFSILPERDNFVVEKKVDTFEINNSKMLFEEISFQEKKDEKMDDEKVYEILNIYEIEDKKHHFLIKMIENKKILSDKSFKESKVLEQVPTYHIELEFKSGDFSQEFFEYLGNFLEWLLEELQQSYFILSDKEILTVQESIRKILKVKNASNKEFGVPEPVEILRKNFHPNTGVINVKDDTSVGYLPNGELCYLYILEDVNLSGKVLLIKSDLSVINTGKKVDGYDNTLAEGYFQEDKNTFIMTDVLYYKGKDIRDNYFFEGGKAKDKFRFDFMHQFFIDGLKKSVNIKEEYSEETTRFMIVRFLFGVGGKFMDNVRLLFDEIKTQEYDVIGLLFKVNREHYPKEMDKWYQSFVWRYRNFKTVNFLVEKVKNGKVDKVTPFQLPSQGKDLYGKTIYFKTLNLKVGGVKEIYSNKEKRYKNIFTSLDFVPKGMTAEENIGIANIILDSSNRMMTEDPNTGRKSEILDKMIVEMTYDPQHKELTNLFKWKPLRVNYAKTRQYQMGSLVFGDTEKYANHMWNSYMNIITESMLRDDNVPEEKVEQYYLMNNNEIRLKKYPFQVFHNRVVKDKLIMEVSPSIIGGKKDMTGSLLDLAVGSGGDFMKWKLGLIKEVVGIDIYKDNIEKAYEFYKRQRRPKPEVKYLWGDSSKLIFPDFECGENKKEMEKVFLSKFAFDIVSCQFAIHYFFESEITLRTFLQNVTDNLKVGGFFVGTSLDGKRVFELLKGLKKPAEGFVGDDLLWRIEKKYSLKTWAEKKPNLGQKIEVLVSTIGIPHEEYLVNYEYLKELALEYGLKVKKIRGFGEIYDGALKEKNYEEELSSMSEGEKVFSFLHNEFIFVKEKEASDKTYGKLMLLKEKEEKKKKRLEGMKGGNIKIVLRKKKD